jgi:hypothetical protein
MFTFKKIRAVVTLCLAAGVMVGAAAAVPMQTVKDSAVAGRLVVNGHKIFISGMNIAWNSFANDVGDNAVNITPFINQFKQIKNAGGNAVRWWLHTDNQKCPKLDANGKVTGLGTKTIDNIRTVLDSAYNYGIVVSLCLFSFDLLNNDGNNKTQDQMNKNEKFLTVPENLDSYIEKGLKPMLNAVGNHPAIMCWEVFNEPEGMSSDAGGWSTKKIKMENILRFTAKIAAEVHRSTKKMASSGIHEYGKMKTWYSDAKLKTASGSNDALAFLDFYMAHYYPEYIGTSGSPFHNKANSWGMDRPILIGEFPAQSWGPGTGYSNIQSGTAMTITAAYEYAYDNGYCGALSWSMTEGDKAKFGSFATTEPALKNLSNKHKADIDLGGSTPVVPTGDQVMKIALKGLPTSDPLAELAKEASRNLSNNTNISFDIYIPTGSNTNLTILPVIKVGSDWVWSPATDNAFSLAGKETGKWITVTVPINKFVPEKGSLDKSAVKAIILQFQPTGSAYTGTIYIDDIKVDNTVIYNFNDMGSEWDMTKWVNNASAAVPEATVSQVAKSTVGGSTPIITTAAKPAPNHAPFATVNGKTLKVTGLDNAEASVKLVNLKGKTIANFKAIGGDGSFSLADIPAGNYLAELTANGKKLGSSRVVVR